MKKRFSTATVIVLCLVALLLGTQVNNLISGDNIFDQLNKFKDVLSLTEKFYVENVDTPKLVESAINGLLEKLDPHSVYIPASQLQGIKEDFQGNFEGIGIEFDIIDDTLTVITAIHGGPSEALGIMAGDKIVKIDDSTAIGIKQDMVPKKLKGPKGTHVKVSIARSFDKNTIDFDITRDKIPLNSVDVSLMVGTDVGYVRVIRFSATTHDEFVAAMTKLRASGMKKLILDLRDNGGGLLDQAYKMADEFLTKGKLIVYTKARITDFDEKYVSTGSGSVNDIPLIVLVSHGTASASEIVSGAVQDWDRGLIVGETSFGKGLVQRPFELSDHSELRLTIARYYTPSGRLIQRPYDKDRDEYRKNVVQDKQDGENLDHTMESDSSRPVFKTAGGRKVLGGGGITPDFVVKSEKLTSYTANLRSKNVFLEYSSRFMERKGKELRQRYGDQMKRFVSEFQISDEMIKELTDLGTKKGTVMNESEFKTDRAYILAFLKSQIARTLWGNDGAYSILLTQDDQFQKAMTLFPEAVKVASLH